MTCRVFILDSNDLWLVGFMVKLRAMGWQVQFAVNLEEFKFRFVEPETDILILRGIEDLATFEYLQSMFGLSPTCGLIWLHTMRERFSSPYFQIADHRVPLEITDIELIEISKSLFKLLIRRGWR